MDYLLNYSAHNVYYTDTDCFVIDRPLSDVMISDQIGSFKLEHVIKKAVFLAPKVYAYVLEDGREVIKVKGLTAEALSNHNIHFDDMEKLLVRDASLELNQDKWYKDVMSGTIDVRKVAYQLKTTANKRDSLYINNVFTATRPFTYSDIIREESLARSI